MPGSILFCYDGSDGSRSAMKAAGALIDQPAEGFVLVVWQPSWVRLEMAAGFAPGILVDEAEIDRQEASEAHFAAQEGARLAKEHGFDLTELVERTEKRIAHTILEVADRLNVALIVSGQRGRGSIRSALLGSVSHELVAHAHRPVLIAPELAKELSKGESK